MAATQRLSVKRKNFGQNASLSRANMIEMASAEYRLVCMILLYAIIFRSADLCIVIEMLACVSVCICMRACFFACLCVWESLSWSNIELLRQPARNNSVEIDDDTDESEAMSYRPPAAAAAGTMYIS